MGKILSIAVPAYNVEAYLADCLDSLLAAESREKTEILIIDDGATDATGHIADKYQKNYPQIIKVIHKENGGHGSAVNRGMKEATGKYFKVVDSDDYVDSKEYEKYLKKLEETDCDLVVTPFTCVRYRNAKENEASGVLTEKWKEEKRRVEGAKVLENGRIYSFEEVARTLFVKMHEATIRTSILQKHGVSLTEHCFYVDMQYILYPIPWIKTICLLEENVYCYRLGMERQSVSVKNMQKNREQHRKVLYSLVQFYEERKQAGEQPQILFYLAKGIAKLQADEVQIALSLPIGKTAKNELLAQECYLRKGCFPAYRANVKKSIWLLRWSNYVLYPVAAFVWKMMRG